MTFRSPSGGPHAERLRDSDGRRALDIHLVEAGGRGGVFHHSLGLGEALAQAGHAVTLHTAHDHELGGDRVWVCPCVKWSRRLPSPFRQLITGARFLSQTERHLRRVTRGADVLHVQGWFHPLLTRHLVRRLRGRCLLAFTPHNTFSRRGTGKGLSVIVEVAHLVDLIFVFSQSDQDALSRFGLTSILVELALAVAPVDSEAVAAWRRTWGEGPVALLAGQVRPDKGPDMFLEAVARVGSLRAVVVGEDKGGMAILDATSARLGLDVAVFPGYRPFGEFIAALAAADVVVLPYSQGSVSGPAAQAQLLGTPVVASCVGGIGAQVTHPVIEMDAGSFASAIEEALAGGRLPQRQVNWSAPLYVASYEEALGGGTAACRSVARTRVMRLRSRSGN